MEWEEKRKKGMKKWKRRSEHPKGLRETSDVQDEG
jgi:hypothetical protein